MVIYLPLLAVCAYLIWRSSRVMPAAARASIVLGLGCLVGAFVVEGPGVVVRRLEARGIFWPNDVRVALEEGLELGGWLLVALGLGAACHAAGRAGARAPGESA